MLKLMKQASSAALFFMAEQSIAALNALSGQAVDYRETAVYGENFVVSEWDESHICVGDRYRIGSCLVEISQPRRPCSRLSKNSGWSEMQKTVFQHGLTGWYARVVEGGEIHSGDTLELQSRPYPQWTIKRLNALLSGECNAFVIGEALACELLAAAFKRALEGKFQGGSGMVAG
ncbi:MOSC domain-containing protein [Neisseria chenwenguii]|uniref:MOSC domain-containing protein n=1 Tax=Neisseria chenwenguii TaxID=1853278 RepID=UPI0018F2B7FF|nr:MOSC domain-containing protein [Neisseria chenwenguii]